MLVVEDSLVSREFLVHLLESDPDIQVVGVCSNGEEALEAVARLRPDLITMDVHMPKMDGLEATRRIMETYPTPIVIVSGSGPMSEVASSFATVEAGALAVLPRPRGVGHPEHRASAEELIRTVKLMAEVKVVRRWASNRRPAGSPGEGEQLPRVHGRIRIVGIGASTGGPQALQKVLAGLPRDFSVPILIVQHMSEGFIEGFATWLSAASGFPVRVAAAGEYPQAGVAYLAPDGSHLIVGRGGALGLDHGVSENSLRPAVSVLFRSLAEVYGSSVIAGLLSGMGRDGAEELKRLRDLGAMTFVQDKESSIVHGMAGEAVRLGAARMVLAPEKVPGVLTRLVDRREGGYPP